jgi:hypothetical protein
METENVMEQTKDVWQQIMNEAYDTWGDKQSMGEWFNNLTLLQREAVAVGKLNQQVCNGGWYQWIFNGYAKVMGETAFDALRKFEQTPEVRKVVELTQNVLHEADNKNYGEGEYDYDGDYQEPEFDFDVEDGAFYSVNDKMLEVGEQYFRNPDGSQTPAEPPKTTYKPTLSIIGKDGNAFAILGKARETALKYNLDWETIENEATSGDYNNLLRTMCKYFDVC